jgi:hypothetical protein
LHYVSWEGQSDGHPKALTINDLGAVLSSKKIFARKFEADFPFEKLKALIR